MLNKKQHDRVERKTVEVHKTLRGKEKSRMLECGNEVLLYIYIFIRLPDWRVKTR
jgi:hypothetical protein